MGTRNYSRSIISVGTSFDKHNLINFIQIVHKIIVVHRYPEDVSASTLDKRVEQRRNIKEVIDISNEENVKEMMLRIPKPPKKLKKLHEETITNNR